MSTRMKLAVDLKPGDAVVRDPNHRPYVIREITQRGAVLEAAVDWTDGEGGQGRRIWPANGKGASVMVAV